MSKVSNILSLMNDTRDLLTSSKNTNVVINGYLSKEGYTVCQLFAVGLGDKLYRIQSYKLNGKWHCSISIKNGFVFNTDIFVDENTVPFSNLGYVDAETSNEYLTLFIEALKINKWDEIISFHEGENIPSEIANICCYAIYSPILTI